MDIELCRFTESGFLENKLYEFEIPFLNFDNYGNATIEYKTGQFLSMTFYLNDFHY